MSTTYLDRLADRIGSQTAIQRYAIELLAVTEMEPSPLPSVERAGTAVSILIENGPRRYLSLVVDAVGHWQGTLDVPLRRGVCYQGETATVHALRNAIMAVRGKGWRVKQ